MLNKGNCMLGEYVEKTLGIRFSHNGIATKLVKTLPQYLKGIFDFSLVEIDGQEFLLLTLLPEIDLPVSQIVKFSNQISKQTGKLTLMQFQSIDYIRRRTLITNRANFVVPHKQIYIPALRMYLNESGSIQNLAMKENLSPAAQFLLLFHLQKSSLEGLPFKDVAARLNYSKKTISIVVMELQKLSICDVEQVNGHNKVLRFNKKSGKLWNSISDLLTSPVQKVWYIEKKYLPLQMPLYVSYDTALAHYTFMADTSLVSFAVDKKTIAEYQNELREFLHPEEGDVRLEFWKYDPALLAEGKFIDKLSLALCYKDSDDERVSKEINEMIDNMIW